MKEEIKNVLVHLNPEEIWSNIDGIMSSGADINFLIDLGEPSPGYFARNYETLLQIGASPSKLFEINEEWYLLRSDWPEELRKTLSVYIGYGLNQHIVDNWLEKHVGIKRFSDFNKAGLSGEVIR